MKHVSRFLFTAMLVLAATGSQAQDSLYARHIVDTLTSTYFWGRGYTRDGMQRAAHFLQQQFSSLHLQPLAGKSFEQPFSYPVNTFPGSMEVSINHHRLEPGKDYILAPESRGVEFNGNLIEQDSTHFMNPAHRLVVVKEDKLTWSVAQEAADYTAILLDRHRFSEKPQQVEAKIGNQFIRQFNTANIAGMVKGTAYPDSFLVITAHYDHLGGMGSETYFPGANDNASGIGLLLSLARYYTAHPQPYSIAMICFAGEEAGLVGSKYFTEHPLIPLKQIRFLLNLDLEGTGEEGITVVNATEYPDAFAVLQKLNEQHNYVKAVHPRGKAANSDHYWFTEKGVPAFFLYTMGGVKAYHDVFDRAATLPLNKIDDLVSLVKDFFDRLMNSNKK